MDLTQLTLVQANRAQVIVSRKRHVKEWGQGLSEEQYLAREERFEQLEHAADGKMITWALVPKNDTETLDFFCSCETYRRTALKVTPPSTEPKEVTAYGIASVFCAPQHRRHGYASHMMRLLHHALAPRTQLPPPPGLALPTAAPTPALFSVLYSDVGEFYAPCGPAPHAQPGWLTRDPVSTRWPATLAADADPADPPATLLALDACRALWEADAQHIRAALAAHPRRTPRVAFLPTAGVGAFLALRASAFTPGAPPPAHWGVVLPGGTAYATWTFDMRVLVATRLRATGETLPALVRALLREARAVGATAVEVWNLPLELRDEAARLGGTTALREEHLPAIAWYGEEDPKDVEWLFNEKFPWC